MFNEGVDKMAREKLSRGLRVGEWKEGPRPKHQF